ATSDDPVLGTILIDGAGYTLYVRIDETETDLSCIGECLQSWTPALVAPGDLGAETLQTLGLEHVAAELTSFARPEGFRQLSYDGRPLYRASGAAPGDTQANGLDGSWFAVNVTPVVRVVSHPVHGQILVGPNGRTLYTYDDDVGVEEGYRCAEACSENFPPLVVSNSVFIAGSKNPVQTLSTILRLADSWLVERVQVTYQD